MEANRSLFDDYLAKSLSIPMPQSLYAGAESGAIPSATTRGIELVYDKVHDLSYNFGNVTGPNTLIEAYSLTVNHGLGFTPIAHITWFDDTIGVTNFSELPLAFNQTQAFTFNSSGNCTEMVLRYHYFEEVTNFNLIINQIKEVFKLSGSYTGEGAGTTSYRVRLFRPALN